MTLKMTEYAGAQPGVTGRFYTGRPGPGCSRQEFGHSSLQRGDRGHERGFTLL